MASQNLVDLIHIDDTQWHEYFKQEREESAEMDLDPDATESEINNMKDMLLRRTVKINTTNIGIIYTG